MQCTITRTREDRLSMHDLITCNGETHTIKEWANLHDIDYVTLMARMRRGCSGCRRRLHDRLVPGEPIWCRRSGFGMVPEGRRTRK